MDKWKPDLLIQQNTIRPTSVYSDTHMKKKKIKNQAIKKSIKKIWYGKSATKYAL